MLSEKPELHFLSGPLAVAELELESPVQSIGLYLLNPHRPPLQPVSSPTAFLPLADQKPQLWVAVFLPPEEPRRQMHRPERQDRVFSSVQSLYGVPRTQREF